MPVQRFFARGKILISGEYAVLKGAKALAIPSVFGQELSVSPGDLNLNWESLDHEGKKWFEAVFDLRLNLIKTSDKQRAHFIQKVLKASYEIAGQKPDPLNICSFLEFPSNWGLGSSSTLTHLLAQHFGIDPFALFFATQNGSAYDIACAGESAPLIYQLIDGQPHYSQAKISPVFREVLFVHLGHKQDSRAEISRFKKLTITNRQIEAISGLTESFIQAETKSELQLLMDKHEALLSAILQRPSVGNELFPQYTGKVKSLGAWGGDFVMALGEESDSYFKNLGYSQVFTYADLFGGSGDK